MPKRKRDDKDSYSDIKKKLRKLEKKLEKRRRKSSLSSSDSERMLSTPQDNTIIELDYNEHLPRHSGEPTPSTSASCSQPLQMPNVPEATQDPTLQELVQEIPSTENMDQHQELDATVLEILGTDPSSTTSFGKEIQKDLAIRYEFIATSGLTKELRKELIESHLPPVNCKLIAAPSLNPEIKAAVNDVIVKRDKAMQSKQNQISSAIACLSEALTNILSKETIDPNILKLLVDTGRILCDCQHHDSITRRNFILAVLKKDLKDQVQLTKIDSLLFGQELADTLKTAKAINKSGAELKSLPPFKPVPNKPKPPSSNKTLNWKGPASYRRPTGPRRTKEAATLTRQQQPQSSRGSRSHNHRKRQ